MTMKGQHHTQSTKQKMSEAKPKRPIVALHLVTGEVEVFESVRHVEKHGMASSNVTACLKGRVPTSYKRCWMYLEDYDPEALEQLASMALSNGRVVLSLNERKIVRINPETGSQYVYDSVRDAVRDGYRASAIYGAMCGKYKKYRGFVWRWSSTNL